MPVEPWNVIAVNLPEHRDNAIHTDAGAQAAGYPSALVAGVTTYAYLTHPCVAAWGLDWLQRGGGTVAFKAPVFADDRVDLVPTATELGVDVVAVCASQARNPRAVFSAVRVGGPPPAARAGERLETITLELGGRFGSDYGWRAGDDLALFVDEGIVHPAVWPALANHVYATQLVNGPWIHTRSTIRHHAIAHVGDLVNVHSVVVERFSRNGARAVTDVVIERDGTPVATIEHEAIVDLNG
jgi:acyl dehydratase